MISATVVSKIAAKTVSSLRAIGMKQQLAWLLSAGVIVTSLVTTELLGGLFAHLGMWLLCGYLGRKFDQFWTAYEPSSVYTCYIRVFATILISLIVLLVYYKSRNRRRHKTAVRVGTGSLKTISGFGAALLAISAISIWFAVPLTSILYFPSIIVAVTGAALLACSLSWVSIGKPLRETGIVSSASTLTLTPMVAIVISLTTLTAISFQGHANALNYGKPDGDNYLTAANISSQHVSYLKSQFPEVMRNSIIFALPDESRYMPRIVPDTYRQCFNKSDNPDSCRQWMDLIGFTISAPPGEDLTGYISPELGETQQGNKFDIALISAPKFSIIKFIPLTLDKKVNPRLTQANLPGWIANPNDARLQQAGIVPGPDRRIYIPDFATKPIVQQTGFRRAAATVSPSIAITEATSVNTSSLHKLSLAVLALGFTLSAVLTGTGLTLARKRSAALQFVVNNYGGGDSLLRNLRLREVSPYLCSIIVSTIIGWLMSTPGVAGRGPTPHQVSAGYTWLIPPVLLTIIFLAEAFHLPKDRRKLSAPQE